MGNRTCSVEGCDKPVRCRNWCGPHYDRWRVHGDPLGGGPPRGVSPYRFNDAFFDAISTEEQAYWLGFVTADGCVRTGQHRNRVHVKLMESDVGHLEKFKASLGSDRPILHEPRRGVSGASATLVLTSARMVAALATLGVGPRKSGTVCPWSGPPDLMAHYWRGMIDGDGCIRKEKDRNNWSVALCGSKACIDAFAAWAHLVCGSASKPFFQSNIWRWKVAGLAAPQGLARELYGQATVYLDRKYDLALDLIGQTLVRDRSLRTEFCTVADCQKQARTHNMCQLHYRYTWVASGPDCIVSGCMNKRFARERCSSHYKRLLKMEANDVT